MECLPVGPPQGTGLATGVHQTNSCPTKNSSSFSFHFCSLLLKQFKVLADTVSSSMQFHHVIILSLKKCCLKSVLNLTFFNFKLCPQVRDDVSKVKNLLKST